MLVVYVQIVSVDPGTAKPDLLELGPDACDGRVFLQLPVGFHESDAAPPEGVIHFDGADGDNKARRFTGLDACQEKIHCFRFTVISEYVQQAEGEKPSIGSFESSAEVRHPDKESDQFSLPGIGQLDEIRI